MGLLLLPVVQLRLDLQSVPDQDRKRWWLHPEESTQWAFCLTTCTSIYNSANWFGNSWTTCFKNILMLKGYI